ncbi:MAG: hypothetical protein QOG82_1049 [Actinomycetota bacterium]|jgi:tetratricopeptide (TPR) repeat protein|nr:hypothetical protein [Actinomycetota bacterium]
MAEGLAASPVLLNLACVRADADRAPAAALRQVLTRSAALLPSPIDRDTFTALVTTPVTADADTEAYLAAEVATRLAVVEEQARARAAATETATAEVAPEEPEVPFDARRFVRRRVTPAVKVTLAVCGAILTVVSIVGLVSGWLRDDPSPPLPRLSGDLNVAVAPFERLDTAGVPSPSEEGADLADSVAETMAAELDAVNALEPAGSQLDIEVLPPSRTLRIEGASAAARAAAASALATRVNADLIVYGTITADGTVFRPEILFSSRKLAGALELVGQYNLGSPVETRVDPATNATARAELRAVVTGRVQSLAQFLVGLNAFAAGQYQVARDHFAAAEASPAWPATDGKEIVYLFLGNTALKLDDIDGADREYQRGLALAPDFARLRFGAAQVQFQRGSGRAGCSSGTVDEGLLRQSIAGYTTLQQQSELPPEAFLGPKSDFAISQVEICLVQAGLEQDLTPARDRLTRVIAAYEAGTADALLELAAESHALLGFLALPGAGAASAPAAYAGSIGEYRAAIALTRDPQRRAVLWGLVAGPLQKSGDIDGARSAYDEAIRLTTDATARSSYEAARAQLG